MRRKTEKIKKIAQEVNGLLKAGTAQSPPVVSLNDIIPHKELHYLRAIDRPLNVKKYGEEKVSRYERHNVVLSKVREKAESLENLYKEKGIPAAFTTACVAMTLCGFGECQETSNRALLELIVRLAAAKINVEVSMITVEGIRKLSPRPGDDFYRHTFLFIGKPPGDFGAEAYVDRFNDFSDACILLDPSLGLVMAATDVSKILKENFPAYGLSKVVSAVRFDVHKDKAERARVVFNNAKEMSDIIKQDLKDIFKDADAKKVTSTVKEVASVVTFNDNLPTFFNINWSARKNFSSTNLLPLESEEYKPQKTVLLPQDASQTSWEEIEKVYDQTTDAAGDFMEILKL